MRVSVPDPSVSTPAPEPQRSSAEGPQWVRSGKPKWPNENWLFLGRLECQYRHSLRLPLFEIQPNGFFSRAQMA